MGITTPKQHKQKTSKMEWEFPLHLRGWNGVGFTTPEQQKQKTSKMEWEIPTPFERLKWSGIDHSKTAKTSKMEWESPLHLRG